MLPSSPPRGGCCGRPRRSSYTSSRTLGGSGRRWVTSSRLSTSTRGRSITSSHSLPTGPSSCGPQSKLLPSRESISDLRVRFFVGRAGTSRFPRSGRAGLTLCT